MEFVQLFTKLETQLTEKDEIISRLKEYYE